MKYLIILLLATFPLGQLIRINVPSTEIVLHPNDIVVALVVTVWLILKRKTLKTVFNHTLTKPLGIFLAATILSLVMNINSHSPKELLTATLYPLRFFIYGGLFYLFYSLNDHERKLSVRWLLISVIGVAGFGLAQYIFVPNVAFLSAFDWDDHYFRLVGSFLDPGFTGAILVLGLLLAFLATKIKRFGNLTLLYVLYLAVALTYSRASYFMFLVCFAAIAFYKKSVKIFVIAAIVLAVTIPILPKSSGEGTKLSRENSVIARVKNWGQSIQIWQTSPVWGIGFNTYRYVAGMAPQSHSGGADSSLLLVLATTGVLGFLAYLNLLRTMWQVGRNNTLFKVSFLGIIIHSFFNNTLFYPWVLEWLWIVLILKD